ncbi:MAG: InlB B-repeat-containing protein [Bacilli bacterium]|nr:InlB B-repeat-containing protein [Bacilli bacterium]
MKKRRLLFGLTAIMALGLGFNTLANASVLSFPTQIKQEAPTGTEVYKTALFGAEYNSGKIGGYSNNWTATNDGFTVSLTNWNNNNNGWNYVKAGSKNNASIGTITTNAAIDKAITNVIVTVDAITASSINSLKVYCATDAEFTANVQTIKVDAAPGELNFAITSPAANLFYKFEADCKKGSSNGLITVSKIEFCTEVTAAEGEGKITYNLDGGTNSDGNPSVYTEGTELVLQNPTKEGYDFLGWYLNNDTSTYVTKIPSTQTGDVTLTANWAKVSVLDIYHPSIMDDGDKYRIVGEVIAKTNDSTFYIQDGDNAMPIYDSTKTYSSAVKIGNTVDLFGTFSASHSNFTSLAYCDITSDDTTISQTAITDIATVTDDNLYYYVSAKNLKLASSFSNRSASIDGTDTILYYNNASFVNNGSFDPADYSANQYVNVTGVLIKYNTTYELTLTTIAESETYTVTFDANGGTTVDSIDVLEGDAIAAAPVTTRERNGGTAYDFDGWYTPEDVKVAFPYTPTGDITLKAKWTERALSSKEIVEDTDTASSLYYQYNSTSTSDTLNHGAIGVEGTNYADWEDLSLTSDAVFSGNTAGGNEAIQLRTDKSNSGIVTTTSGGTATKVTVSWNTNTASGRSIDIYGSNTAYTAAADLYSTSTRGTKIGTIKNGETELTLTGNYAYIGIRSSSGALYLDSIDIQWSTINITSAAIRYGAVIEETTWTGLGTVESYGVMLASNSGLEKVGAESIQELYDAYHSSATLYADAIATSHIKDLNYTDEVPVATDKQLTLLGKENACKLFNVYVDLTSYLKEEISALAYVTVGGERIFLNEVKYSVKTLAAKYIADYDIYTEASFDGTLGYLANL